jgi:hypothetical protein
MNKPTHREFEIKLPMRLRTSSKKVTALNLNVYRNLHYRSLTALKHKFQNNGKKLLKTEGIPPLGRIQLQYRVFAKTKREFDVANICSIVDKFFCDTLTHAGIIEDDNWKFLDSVSFGFGGFDTEEYVLVTITEIEPRKGNPMRILLDEDEIQTALEAYVQTMGLSGVTGVDLTSDDDGNVSAEVLMGNSKPATKKAPAKSRGGRPKGSKNKPKEEESEDDDVEVSGEDSNAGDGAGDAEPAKTKSSGDSEDSTKAEAKAGSKSSKNLFGDEETESSKGDVPEEAEDAPAVKPAKKSSIFDQ